MASLPSIHLLSENSHSKEEDENLILKSFLTLNPQKNTQTTPKHKHKEKIPS